MTAAPTPPVVIFMTSNGVGMGHLSRQLTIALSGTDRFKSVIFSLSGALPTIVAADRAGDLPEAAAAGIRYEYCPSRDSGWLPPGGWKRALRTRYRSYRWHPYVRDRLVALAIETQASAIVFDGVVPYEGLLQARALLPDVPSVWVRGAMWLPSAPTKRLEHAREFDLVLQPGDYGSAADRGPLAGPPIAHEVAPYSLFDVLTPTTRDNARAALGLPLGRSVMLLALGSGAQGSIEQTASRILAEVRSQAPDWIVAVTRQNIAQHQIGEVSDSGDRGSIVVLNDVYPLARHLQAFDAAIGAAGYNAVHEFVGARIPTLLVPSVHHVTDDQGARARGVADSGATLLADEAHVEVAVAELLDESVRARLVESCAGLEPTGGGREAADLIGSLADHGAKAHTTRRVPRPHRPIVDARTPVHIGSGRALFSEDIASADIRGQQPVEHLIEGSSAKYRAARAQASAWLFRPEK